MIVSLEGAVQARGPDFLVVTVGGVGFQVFAPTSTLSAVGEQGQRVRLHTYLHYKEDGPVLYGFAAPEELRLFQMLMGVNGVGPRTSLSALSTFPADGLARAIAAEDADALTRIPGVGKKTAARIVLELKGRLEKEWVAAPGAPVTAPVDADALAALTALGYSLAEARAALASIDGAAKLPLEEKIRRALQRIGGR